eukprot:jgi/Mesvir1/27756/Mv07443-RA.3
MAATLISRGSMLSTNPGLLPWNCRDILPAKATSLLGANFINLPRPRAIPHERWQSLPNRYRRPGKFIPLAAGGPGGGEQGKQRMRKRREKSGGSDTGSGRSPVQVRPPLPKGIRPGLPTAPPPLGPDPPSDDKPAPKSAKSASSEASTRAGTSSSTAGLTPTTFEPSTPARPAPAVPVLATKNSEVVVEKTPSGSPSAAASTAYKPAGATAPVAKPVAPATTSSSPTAAMAPAAATAASSPATATANGRPSPSMESATAGADSGSNPKVLLRRALRQLSSLPLAISQMALIAAFSAVGTVIPQDQDLGFYQATYPEGGPNPLDWTVIKLFGLDHVYSTPWFLTLLGLLAVSLMACTATRQIPMLRAAQRWFFALSPAAVAKQGTAYEVEGAELLELSAQLAARGYQVFLVDKPGASQSSSSSPAAAAAAAASRSYNQPSPGSGPGSGSAFLYAFKGLAGRLAPIGVHASMVFIMAGAAWGACGGFKGDVMIPQGQAVPLMETVRPTGPLAGQPSILRDFGLQVNNFRIEYLPSGMVSQFYSDLSIVSPRGQAMETKEISVNDPLRFQGLTVYQTDWDVASVDIEVGGDGQILRLPMAKLPTDDDRKKLYGAFLPLDLTGTAPDSKKGISIIATDLQQAVLYDAEGQFVGVRRPESGKPIEVSGLSIVVRGVIGSTGLQLKASGLSNV